MKPFSSTLQDAVIRKIDRRSFLKASGMTATGIILGLQAGCTSAAADGKPFSPNVYLTINPDGSVFIVAHRSEMGTGIRTGLPLIVADELEADWKRVKVVQAVADEKTYGNQNTDGSFSVRMFFQPMRKAGAMARKMLEQAAANQWSVPVSECTAINHEVIHTSGKKLTFGELTTEAAKLTAPKDEELTLKKKGDWKYIGKSTDIVDINDVVSGHTTYGIDAKVAGMKYAVIMRCPVVGGKVKSFNADKAKQVPGFIKIFEMESKGFPTDFSNPAGGIVILADNTYAAIAARRELEVEWDLGPNADYNSASYFNEMMAKVKSKGHVRREQGSIDEAIKKQITLLNRPM
jgi:isoquinoline 1-oxidoreductase beta subunit